MSTLFHSITFGYQTNWKNTWADWKLIPSTRPLFNPPQVKTNTISIPGGDGSLDLSTAAAGRPLYENRTGSIEFYVWNDYPGYNWAEVYSDIMEYLHGRHLQAVLEDDPEYFYEGRFWVSGWRSEKDYSKITIDYDVDPYKHQMVSDESPWLWDPFNFERDMIIHYREIPVNGTITITLRIPNWLPEWGQICPTITAHGNWMTVEHEGVVYPLLEGVNKIEAIRAGDNDTMLTFSGHGTVTIGNPGDKL